MDHIIKGELGMSGEPNIKEKELTQKEKNILKIGDCYSCKHFKLCCDKPELPFRIKCLENTLYHLSEHLGT